MKQLSVETIVSRAWDLAVKHWPLFVLIVLIEQLFGNIGLSVDQATLTSLGQNPDPVAISQALGESVKVSPWIILSVLVSLYLGYVTYRLLRNAITTGKPYESLGDELKIDINSFAIFFAVDVVYGLAIGLGSLLCILPGIFIAVRWMFAPYIAATEDVSFGEAFRRSWQLTQGYFWKLFLLGLVAILIGIVGLICCCVGYLFAAVIINFMLVVAYQDLKEDVC